MKELLRTNDMVLISYIESVLRDAGIGHVVLDGNMSVLEGSIGVLPRRVMVENDELDTARGLMDELEISYDRSLG